MPEAELFLLFTRRFEATSVPYAVTGAVASIIYGEPRMTHDIDLLLDPPQQAVDTLLESFPEHEFYRPPREVILVEIRRRQRGHFNLIHHETGYKADCYTAGTDPLHKWALAERQRVVLDDNDALWVAPPEYVILRKVQYFRESGYEKHLADVAGMLETSPDEIDTERIASLVAQYGLQDAWEQARKIASG